MPRPGGDVFSLDERRVTLDGKSFKLSSFEVAHSTLYGMHDDGFHDRHFLRSFCTSSVLQWSAFDGIRSDKTPVQLTAAEERAVAEEFAKLTSSPQDTSPTASPKDKSPKDKSPKDKSPKDKSAKDKSGGGKVCGALPNRVGEPQHCVSRILSARAPALCRWAGDAAPLRGATFLLLAAVTGDAALARRCVALGANPNGMQFLSDPDAPPNQMQHGYSPMFVAVLAGHVAVMDVLHEVGGSLHVFDRWGRSPLHAAVATENAAALRWLRAVGAPRGIGCAPPDAMHKAPVAPRIAAITPPRGKGEEEKREEGKEEGGKKEEGEKEEKEANIHATSGCTCQSGKPRGYCGCVDDMFERWTYDRLQSRWCAGKDFCAIAAKSTANTRGRTLVVG